VKEALVVLLVAAVLAWPVFAASNAARDAARRDREARQRPVRRW